MVIVEDIDSALSTLGTSRSDRFRRNSFLVLREHFQSSEPPLRIELMSRRKASATDVATITQAVQDAAARVALLLMHPKEDRTRLDSTVRSRAELIPQGQSGNTLYFQFPRRVRNENQLDGTSVAHLAEEAMRELVNTLPESPTDTQSLQVLSGRRVGIRSAVANLARAVSATDDICLSLKTGREGRPQISIMTKTQASEISELLMTKTTEVTEASFHGILDGMRSRRRLFYVVSEDPLNTQEFEGVVEPSLLPSVQSALNERVHAKVSKTVTVSGDGTRSHPVYSLLSLQIDPSFE